MENTETIQFGQTPTLRDQFAMAALSGIIAANEPCGKDADKIVAAAAYLMADAMLAERGE